MRLESREDRLAYGTADLDVLRLIDRAGHERGLPDDAVESTTIGDERDIDIGRWPMSAYTLNPTLACVNCNPLFRSPVMPIL